MKKILTLILGIALCTPAFASVAVSPTRIEINANKIKGNYITTAIDIKGDEKTPMRFKAYPGFFTINEKSDMVMIDDSNDPHDLSKKIRFVPSEFTVAQGKSQKLRINIANLNTLPDGESRTVLYIEDVNPKEFTIPNPVEGIATQIILKSRIGVPIYVDKGKVFKIGEIEYFNVKKEKDGYYGEVKVLSKGNSRIRYSGTLQVYQGKKIIEETSIVSRAVGDNNYYIDKFKISTGKIEKDGDYTARVILSYFDENGKRKIMKQETNFSIKGSL